MSFSPSDNCFGDPARAADIMDGQNRSAGTNHVKPLIDVTINVIVMHILLRSRNSKSTPHLIFFCDSGCKSLHLPPFFDDSFHPAARHSGIPAGDGAGAGG